MLLHNMTRYLCLMLFFSTGQWGPYDLSWVAAGWNKCYFAAAPMLTNQTNREHETNENSFNHHQIAHGNWTNMGLFLYFLPIEAALPVNHFGANLRSPSQTISSYQGRAPLLQLCLVVKEMGGGEKSCFFLPAPNNGLFLPATPCPPSLTYWLPTSSSHLPFAHFN